MIKGLSFGLIGIFLVGGILLAKDNLPDYKGYVNDFANVINDDYRKKLEALSDELEKKTSAEVAVVTMNSIAPYDEKQYARLLFDKWKPGKKGRDNGILVLLAIKERRWRIETGYGVEGILPDGLCGEIGRNYMVPYFKQGRYSEGLYIGVAAIAKIISNKQISKIQDLKIDRSSYIFKKYFSILLVLFIFGFVILTSFKENLFYFCLIILGVWFFLFEKVISKNFKAALPFLIWPFVILVFLRIFFYQLIKKKTIYTRKKRLKRDFWRGFAGGFGGIGAGGFGGGFGGFGGGGGGGGGGGAGGGY